MADNVADEARALHLRGHLCEAESLYRETLRGRPDDMEALQGLGVLAYQNGRAAEAVDLFVRALVSQPNSSQLHANLGEALRALGRLDEAIGHLHKALELDSTLPDAFHSLGLVAHAQGRLVDAGVAYREALRRRPEFAMAHINLGNVLHDRRDLVAADEAYRSALQVEPDNVAALVGLGAILCDLEDPDLLDEAESLCRRAVALAPDVPQASNGLGDILRAQNRLDEAMECYIEAYERNTSDTKPLLGIGKVFLKRGQYDVAAQIYEKIQEIEADPALYHANLGGLSAERLQHAVAATHYRTAIELNPDLDEAHHGLGLALLELGQLDEAEASLREALRINPTRAGSWVSLARLQAERGELDLSCESARAALELRPKQCDAYCRLANTLRDCLPDSDVRAMQSLLDHRYLAESARANLRFNLAAVFDARGKYTEAATLLETANALQLSARAARGQTLYDPDQYTRFIDGLIAVFDRDLLARGRGWGIADSRPVFVVGLPRSGTTLIEQILASHPEVHGAGELIDVSNLLDALPEIVGHPDAYPLDAVAKLGPESAQEASRRYLERLSALAPASATRVVDKMPDNVMAVGLIALLWPGARVILCNRDLRDIAVSCWHAHFKSASWVSVTASVGTTISV